MSESDMVYFVGEFFGAWTAGFIVGLFFRHLSQLADKI